VAAHVFHHDDLDALLTRAVAPLASHLADQHLISEFFYLRYWEGGPHVRIRLRTAPPFLPAVRQVMSHRLGAYLAAYPSQNVVDESTYLIQSAAFASGENLTNYERTLRPCDSITFEAYGPDVTHFGHGKPLRAAEEHFCESTEIALRTLTLPSHKRLSVAMVMAIATEVALDQTETPEIPEHADDDAAWDLNSDELIAMYRRMQEADISRNHGNPTIDWLRSISALRSRITTCHADGSFDVDGRFPVAQAVYRCLHLHLNRAGIGTDQELRLRRLARRAAQRG
jgi:thiopeptide-type bacteriocin biosynthesis protein